jgi:uncharacterized protein (DUF4213/DUF364 family)
MIRSEDWSQMSTISAQGPWELYERLIEGIPRGIGVKNWTLGRRWSFVESEAGVGIAMTLKGARALGMGGGFLGGDPAFDCAVELRELAAYARSWCFEEASIGVAALNSFYNAPENNPELKACLCKEDGSFVEGRLARQSDIIASEIRNHRGGKVAVIGHFHNLEEFAESCTLSILERNPSGSDFPDPACEFILPEQDLVIITGTSLTNKTLPRLLELSRKVRTVLAGPSCVCAPALFDYAVDKIGGAVVVDSSEAQLWLSHGIHLPFGHGVEMVNFARGQRSAD